MKKYDIAALGELLIDFTQSGYSASGMRLFEQNPGGAPANVLTLAAKQGLKTVFIGKVGQDMHGEYLKNVLIENGISVDGLVMDKHTFTTLAFVSLDENGERSFSFARKPGADTQLSVSELNNEILENCRIFHLGSLSLTDDPARSASFAAIQKAKAGGAYISYDPNFRASLWNSTDEAIELMKKPISLSDIVKLSDEEALMISGKECIEDAAKEILAMGPKCVLITLGAEGAYYAAGELKGYVEAFRVSNVVDTTGAGDAFCGAVLTKLSSSDSIEKFIENIEETVRFANAAAAVCVTRRGAIPAMPCPDEIHAKLHSYE